MKITRKCFNLFKLFGHTLLALFGRKSKKDIGFASRWGRIEHRFGELTGILLAFSFGLAYFEIPLAYIKWSIVFSFFSWLTYFVSHRMEKKLYGGGLRASTIKGR